MAATPESPRLTPLPPNEWSKGAGAALAPLLPPTGRPQGEGRPKGLNALGVLARYPELALAYNTFSGQPLADGESYAGSAPGDDRHTRRNELARIAHDE